MNGPHYLFSVRAQEGTKTKVFAFGNSYLGSLAHSSPIEVPQLMLFR
jgi:hypothetical protein